MSRPRPAGNLLDEIAESALDDDYYLVRAGEPRKDRSANTVAVGLVMILFALLVTVAALQSSLDRPERALERTTMIQDVEDGRASLDASRATVAALEDEIDQLGSGDRTETTRETLDVAVGSSPVRGPGVEITLEGAVTATDLRIVVNELWYAGAEAVAINDQRLTVASAVNSVDGVLQVNYRPLGAPVVVRALGDSETLADRVEAGGAGRHLERRAEADGLRAGVSSSDDLALPGAPQGTESLEHAASLEEDR